MTQDLSPVAIDLRLRFCLFDKLVSSKKPAYFTANQPLETTSIRHLGTQVIEVTVPLYIIHPCNFIYEARVFQIFRLN